MAKVGSLIIEMGADLARIRRDMDQARSIVSSAASGMRTALGGLGLAFGVTGFVQFIKGATDAADNINKLSQRTGIAAESLSQLQYAAKLADVDTTTLSTGIKKLNVSIAEGMAGDKEKIALFKSLGITQKQLGEGTEAVMFRMADAFANAKDGAGKTAISVKLLGKAGDEMIPLLNGGAESIRELKKEADQLGLTISGKFAKDSEEFNDNMARAKASVDGLAVTLGQGVIRLLADVAQAMADAARQGGVLAAAIAGIQTLLTGSDRHKAEKELVELTDRRLALETQIAKMSPADKTTRFGQLAAAGLKDLDAQIKTTTGYLRLMDADDDKRAAAAAASAAGGRPGRPGKQTLALPGGAGTVSDAEKARLAAVKHAKEFIATLEREQEELGLTAEQVKMLTAAREAAKVPDLAMAIMSEAAAASWATKQHQEAQVAIVAENQLKDKAAEDAFARADAAIAANEAQIKAGRTMLEQMEYETRLLTMNAEERAVATAARELETQGIVAGTLAYDAYIKKVLEAARARTRVEEQLDSAKKAADEARQKAKDEETARERRVEGIADSIEDGIMTGFRNGEKFTDIFLKEMKAQFARTVLRPVIMPIASELEGLMGGLFKGILGGISGLGSLGAYGGHNWDFAGGGDTGPGPRTGGLDGQGGFMAMVHPQETIIDRTRPGAATSGGGKTVIINNAPTFNVDSRTDTGEVLAIMRQGFEANNKQMIGMLQRQGVMA